MHVPDATLSAEKNQIDCKAGTTAEGQNLLTIKFCPSAADSFPVAPEAVLTRNALHSTSFAINLVLNSDSQKLFFFFGGGGGGEGSSLNTLGASLYTVKSRFSFGKPQCYAPKETPVFHYCS